MNIRREFIINNYLHLKLEGKDTIIYIGGKRFKQCKVLLLNIEMDNIGNYNNVNSIDEFSESLSSGLNNIDIKPKEEFWAHCSNLQAWAENNYDTRLLHSNIAFPLLKALYKLNDPIAKKVFKEEIAKRILSGYSPVLEYLIEENYLEFLSEGELDLIFENIGYNLYFKKINKIPSFVFKLKKLEEIIIRDSDLYELPEIFGSLKNLKKLHLINCRLNNLPNTMYKLNILEEINLSSNNLKHILKTIGDFTSLKKLNLNRNLLTSLPKNIKSLKKLQFLDLSLNKFEKFPKAIFQIISLNQLFFSNNFLKFIPDSINQLKNLEVLALDVNNISELPISIGNLKYLKSLYIGYNKLKSLPVSIRELKLLEVLSIAGNELIESLSFIENLPNLKQLIIDKNQKSLLGENLKKKVENKKIKIFI